MLAMKYTVMLQGDNKFIPSGCCTITDILFLFEVNSKIFKISYVNSSPATSTVTDFGVRFWIQSIPKFLTKYLESKPKLPGCIHQRIFVWRTRVIQEIFGYLFRAIRKIFIPPVVLSFSGITVWQTAKHVMNSLMTAELSCFSMFSSSFALPVKLKNFCKRIRIIKYHTSEYICIELLSTYSFSLFLLLLFISIHNSRYAAFSEDHQILCQRASFVWKNIFDLSQFFVQIGGPGLRRSVCFLVVHLYIITVLRNSY